MGNHYNSRLGILYDWSDNINFTVRYIVYGSIYDAFCFAVLLGLLRRVRYVTGGLGCLRYGRVWMTRPKTISMNDEKPSAARF